MRFSKASIALLVIQLAIVSTVAAKYLYQRATCPRVWTRANAYDPSLVMRGRYLSLQLTVDGCSSTLPSAKDAQFPRNMCALLQTMCAHRKGSVHRAGRGPDSPALVPRHTPAVHKQLHPVHLVGMYF